MITLALTLLLGTAHAHDLAKHFERGTFKLETKTLDLWVADTDQKRARGLMYVDKLAPDEGMLFVFEEMQPMSFWMKNTMIPLAIGFFDDHCVLKEVIEMNVATSVLSSDVPTYRSQSEAKFALEMNAKWYGLKIKPGARLTPLTKKGAKSASVICK